MRLPPDERERLRIVAVLVGLIATEVDSSTMPTKAAERLLRDIEAIPSRFEAVLIADEEDRRFAAGRKRKKARP